MLLECDTIHSLLRTAHRRDWDSWCCCSLPGDSLYRWLVCCYNLVNGRDCSYVQLLCAHRGADRYCYGRRVQDSTPRWYDIRHSWLRNLRFGDSGWLSLCSRSDDKSRIQVTCPNNCRLRDIVHNPNYHALIQVERNHD